MDGAGKRNCRRVILRKGEEYIIFRTIDIAYFYLENKTCFLVDIRNGNEHKVSGSLRDIFEMLDPVEFYRVNKNYIVSIRAIISLKCWDINKVEVILMPQPTERVYVSQLRISSFKEWIESENAPLYEL
jgi:two-component system, LytTR family, response regulator LytT